MFMLKMTIRQTSTQVTVTAKQERGKSTVFQDIYYKSNFLCENESAQLARCETHTTSNSPVTIDFFSVWLIFSLYFYWIIETCNILTHYTTACCNRHYADTAVNCKTNELFLHRK